jgi:hypothetical protein
MEVVMVDEVQLLEQEPELGDAVRPQNVEADCVHWLWPTHEVTGDIDVPHWFTNQKRENE